MFILILHDWCSSGNRFVRLKNDLTSDGNRVAVMPFPGMGLEPVLWERDILGHYAGMVASYLKHNEVDCVLAHGMGCTVAVRALRMLCTTDRIWTGKVILVSPFYKGLRRLGKVLWAGRLTPIVWKEICGSALTADKWCGKYVWDTNHLDDLMVSDLRAADRDVALCTLRELVEDHCDVVPALGRFYIICGTKDILVRRRLIRNMGRQLYAEDVHWCSCGHYPMVECYSDFLYTVRRYLDA